jgi:hypothetical protein
MKDFNVIIPSCTGELREVSELSDSGGVLLFSELQHDYQPSVPILCGGTRLGLSMAPACRAKVYNPSQIRLHMYNSNLQIVFCFITLSRFKTQAHSVPKISEEITKC